MGSSLHCIIFLLCDNHHTPPSSPTVFTSSPSQMPWSQSLRHYTGAEGSDLIWVKLGTTVTSKL